MRELRPPGSRLNAACVPRAGGGRRGAAGMGTRRPWQAWCACEPWPELRERLKSSDLPRIRPSGGVGVGALWTSCA
jgi:hypothetical protein